MRILHGFEQMDQPSVVVVGSFDGLHSGHRRLVGEVNEEADRLGYLPIVVTFEPHPRLVLRGENRLLTTIEERKILFEQAGVRNLVVVDFTREFAAIEAETFVREMLKTKLLAAVVYTGEGHTFGRNRGGDEEVLHQLGITTRRVERYDGISSTAVRAEVEGGDMESVEAMLGGAYLVVTPVVEPSKLFPPDGCYLCEVDGRSEELTIRQIKEIWTKGTLLIKKRL